MQRIRDASSQPRNLLTMALAHRDTDMFIFDVAREY
jgi:hypothetical protein